MQLDDLKHLPTLSILSMPTKVAEIAELTVRTPDERQELAYVFGVYKIEGESVLLYANSVKQNDEPKSCSPLPLSFIAKYEILRKIIESQPDVKESEPRSFDTSR